MDTAFGRRTGITVGCVANILGNLTISSFTQCYYVLTLAYTHNANPLISLTNFRNKISGHYSIICQSILMDFCIQDANNSSQEEKYGQKIDHRN
jgi:hypothetical protein